MNGDVMPDGSCRIDSVESFYDLKNRWKCDKSNPDLWTDKAPAGFPPIDERSRSMPGGNRTGGDEWWWG